MKDAEDRRQQARPRETTKLPVRWRDSGGEPRPTNLASLGSDYNWRTSLVASRVRMTWLTARNRVSPHGTARSVLLVFRRLLLGSYRDVGKTGIYWRESGSALTSAVNGHPFLPIGGSSSFQESHLC